MRVLFLGTPEFAASVLEALLGSRHRVVGVVTQPPRPRGRGLRVADPPAAALARERGLEVLQPRKLHSSETLEAFARLEPDLIVTAAFGRILRRALLGLPPRGCWNVHASLLPRHRGAAPVTAALLEGDRWTGVTLFQLDEGMDTGPLLLQEMTPVGPEETAGQLTDRLARLGGRLLVEGLDRLEAGGLPAVPQPEWGVTHTRLLEKEDGRIRWNRPADQVDRQIRAVTPWPGAYTFAAGKRLVVHRARPVHLLPAGSPPGSVAASREEVRVACLPGALSLGEVQLEGKRRQSAAEWARGFRLGEPARFDPPGHG
jgi:methionyl-tRNA formyltransferase